MSPNFQNIVALPIGFELRGLNFENTDFEVYAIRSKLEEKDV
jgi:hypothetical protein